MLIDDPLKTTKDEAKRLIYESMVDQPLSDIELERQSITKIRNIESIQLGRHRIF